jgi:uncharacterized tellurite resistance protein B-like protein
LNIFKKLFKDTDESSYKNDADENLRLATCILLIEVSKSDDDFDLDEQKKIRSLIKSNFNLSDIQIEHLFTLSKDTHNEMTSLYEWTDIINNDCSYEQKLTIIGFMWDIAFTDERLDKYEDYTIRKVCDLIHVKHVDFINLKNQRTI